MDKQETIVDKAMPWFSSAMFHLGAILILTFVIFATTEIASGEEPEKPIFNMTYPVSETGNGPTLFKPVNMDDGVLDRITQNIKETISDGFDRNGIEHGDLDKILSRNSGDALDAIYGGNGLNSIGNGVGNNKNGQGGGDFGPGRLAPFNPKESIGFLPPTRGAKRIVYLIDHSGSMVDTFDFLRVELGKKVNSLLPVQNFSVIVFSEDAAVITPMSPALKPIKDKLVASLESVKAAGFNDDTLDPFVNGFRKAFEQKPDMIVFLTDGSFDKDLIAAVTKMNNSNVTISTIAYVKIAPDAAIMLQDMAKDNHGTYKFVSAKELN